MSNMYKGVKTWNPLAGECPHGCSYCSTKSFYYPEVIKKYSGELRLDENAFKKNLGKGNIWFVCAQNDLFAKEVPDDFIRRVYNHIANYPDNEYWFQSKNPKRMYEWAKKPYVYGTTIESSAWHNVYFSRSVPHPIDRAFYIGKIKKEIGCKTFITIEPILEFNFYNFYILLTGAAPDWINIGADSKKNNLVEPNKLDILKLITLLEGLTEVRIKSNLTRLIK